MHLVIRPPAGGFAHQRIGKVGDFSAPRNNTYGIVTGWQSDSANPAMIVGDKLVVAGAGACTIRAYPAGTGSGGDYARVRLMHNGVQIAEKTQNGGWTSVPTWEIPRTVADGDTIWLEANTQTAFMTLTITESAYIEVIPD